MNVLTIRRLARRHNELGIVLITLVLVIVFTTTSGGKWANFFNIAATAQVMATLGIMGLGAALVIVSGEIDVSVGSTFGFAALIYLWSVLTIGPVAAALLAVAAGAGIGIINGFLVTRFNAPSLIITLSTLFIFRGFSIALTEGFSFSVLYRARSGVFYKTFGGNTLLGFNTGVWWMLAVALALAVFVFATPVGNRLLAVGGSAPSAHSRGVGVGMIKILAFTVCGALAALAGVMEAGKLGFADGGMGRLMELQAIAACVLGGCALTGGRMSIIGVVAGAFTLSSIQSYLVVNGVRPQWFILLLGLIVVLAAMGDRSLRDWATRGH